MNKTKKRLCYICNNEIEKTLYFTANNSFAEAYPSIVLRNKYYPTCQKCYKVWEKILESLIEQMKERMKYPKG